MEAEICSSDGLSNVRKVITDIDVMALIPSNSGNLEIVLGDCKTLKSQSPISRALWMNGLMTWMNAQRGIVLLSRPIDKDHKLAASKLKVKLLSEADFETFASCTSDEYKTMESAICSPDSWEEYYNIHKRFPNLKSAIDFVKNGFWNKEDFRSKLRHTILTVREIRNELNPDQPTHIALLADLVALFSVAMSYTVCEIFNQYLLPSSKDQLSDDLKILIWGGIENYKYYNSMYSLVKPSSGTDLRLPEWDKFIQLVRQCLEQPYSTTYVPLILREVAFEYLNQSKTSWSYSKQLANANLQAAKFALFMIEYICKATNVPPEFKEILSNRLLQVQMK